MFQARPRGRVGVVCLVLVALGASPASAADGVLSGTGEGTWGGESAPPVFDSRTMMLLRFDEAGGLISAAQASELFGPTLTTGVSVPIVPGRFRNARSFDGASRYFESHGSPEDMAFLTGEWTAEAWVKPAAALTGANTVLSYGTVSTSAEGNHLLHISLNVSRQVTVLWEDMSAIDSIAIRRTTSASVPAETWTHLAVRKRANGSGSYDVDVFFNGVLTQTFFSLPNSAGGVHSHWAVGRHPSSSREYFKGEIDEIRVSLLRTDAEIQASAQGAHTLDGKTRALWRFDEAVGPFAASERGHVAGPALFGDGIPPLYVAGKFGTGVSFNGTSQRLESYGSYADQQGADNEYAAALSDEWTAEAWLRPRPMSATGFFLAFGASSSLSSHNHLLLLGLNPSLQVTVNWENEAGMPSRTTAASLPLDTWTHVAVRKRRGGAGLYDVDVFLNGVLTETFTGLPNASGGTKSSWAVGRYPGCGCLYFNGAVDEVRVSGLRTDAEIQASVSAPATFDNNTLALWSFEGKAATSADVVTGKRSLPVATTFFAPSGAPVVAGKFGNARSFNGTNQAFEAPGSTLTANALLGEWTLEAWVKPAATETYKMLVAYGFYTSHISGNHLLRVLLNPARQVQVGWENAQAIDAAAINVTTAASLPADTWTRLVVRKRVNAAGAFDVDVFFGTTLVQTFTNLPNASGGWASFWAVGRHPAYGVNYFGGLMDEVRVLNVALSDAEVTGTTSTLRREAWNGPGVLKPVSAYTVDTTPFVRFTLNGREWPSAGFGLARDSWQVRCPFGGTLRGTGTDGALRTGSWTGDATLQVSGSEVHGGVAYSAFTLNGTPFPDAGLRFAHMTLEVACQVEACGTGQLAGTYYPDVDGDGFGAGAGVLACGVPLGHVSVNTDCDDSNAQAHPLMLEACDGLDNDCDGTVDNQEGSSAAFTLVRACENAARCSIVGRQACAAPGAWGACTGCGGVATCRTGCDVRSTQSCNDACEAQGACTSVETCNDCDDDSNGLVDDAISCVACVAQ